MTHSDMDYATPKRLKKQSPSHARAPKQEREIAKRVNGYVTPGSGCGKEKGDVRKRGVLRIEAKTTKNKSFPLTTALIEKLEQASLGHNEVPVVTIEFLRPDGTPLRSLCVLPSYALDLLSERGDGLC